MGITQGADPLMSTALDQLYQYIRTLSIDVVQPVNSGHPGTPMARAVYLYDLESRDAIRSTAPDLAQPRSIPFSPMATPRCF